MLINDFGIDALKTSMRNKYRDFNVKHGKANSGGYRRQQSGLCFVNHVPKFTLSRKSQIYTVGSCFAREVESALNKLGVSLTSDGMGIPARFLNPNHVELAKDVKKHGESFTTRTPINRYSTHSITYDFERVFESQNLFEQSIYKIGDSDEFWDPQIKNIKRGNLDQTREVRTLLDKIISSAKLADAIIVTLGMTETWFDSETGAILPIPPQPLIVKNNPHRFRFFNTTYQEVVENLEKFLSLVSTHIGKETKIIITTSPIPLGTTFTDKDVIVANSRSKSVLCAAAQAFAAKHELVDYFPSYEMVVNSPIEIWVDDGVHVKVEYVEQIMERFVGLYFQN